MSYVVVVFQLMKLFFILQSNEMRRLLIIIQTQKTKNMKLWYIYYNFIIVVGICSIAILEHYRRLYSIHCAVRSIVCENVFFFFLVVVLRHVRTNFPLIFVYMDFVAGILRSGVSGNVAISICMKIDNCVLRPFFLLRTEWINSKCIFLRYVLSMPNAPKSACVSIKLDYIF